ncbi:GH12 family glycosyl hydrolase domain-containing protein [Piscinibacter gummiphilus]|uniref:Glycosyl hydrolase family 12 n=1 Tax=Piscinibacter gummiphilus TaxID=946333 RepID=A0ABZ0CLS5_9BURK|nr:hypothetical protein [Piscinibacter gummiphilus]WOB05915.1 hypothetical protein RXV79_13395 [Piscinibacter gummiphilus]
MKKYPVLFLSLSLALLAASCGGGGGGGGGSSAPAPAPATQLPACGDFATLEVSGLGRLTNNTWNKAAAGNFAATQCLQSRSVGATTQYGWSWSWPTNGSTVYAYPEIIVGWKPWDGGTSNHPHLPARINTLQRFDWQYDLSVSTGGSYNVATSLWITRTGATPTGTNPQDIANEMMIWTAGSGFPPGGQRQPDANIGGQIFEVWYAQDWGDLSGANPNKWSYIAYRATVSTFAATLDIKAILADAVSRGYVNPAHYVSNIELGNEVMSGAGQTWINSLSATIQ